MNVRPVDLPVVRQEALAQLRDASPASFRHHIEQGLQRVWPRGMTVLQAAVFMAEDEARRVRQADLYFVNADMMRLAKAAGTSLPAFSLVPEDLPSPYGLVVFEEPINNGEDAPIVAASWGHWTGQPYTDIWPNGGIWISWWTDSAIVTAKVVEQNPGNASAIRSNTQRLLGRIFLETDQQIPFTDEPLPIYTDGEFVDYADARGEARWIGVLKTVWLLMGQPLACVQDASFDRATRRRLAREAIEPEPVRVITLRRQRVERDGPSSSDREYHHQWLVRGHWRQQWYPAREVHRPVWIAPHIKGPEGAPLIGGEKVYALNR